MTIDATVVDPRKGFSWEIELDGLQAALAQKVTIPEVERVETEHGSGGGRPNRKTYGKMKFGDITIEKLMKGNSSDDALWEKMLEANNPENGETKPPSQTRFSFFINHYGFDGKTIIDRWRIIDAEIKKISYGENDKKSEADNIIETAVFSVYRYERIA